MLLLKMQPPKSIIANSNLYLIIFLLSKSIWKHKLYPANIYLFKVNYKSTRKWSKISLKLKIKTPERRHQHLFIANFEHISHFFLVFLLLTII